MRIRHFMKFWRESTNQLDPNLSENETHPYLIPYVIIGLKCREMMLDWNYEAVAIDKFILQCT